MRVQRVTLEELASRTEEILDAIQKDGCPVVVTQHGRHLATVVPLETKKEGAVCE